MWRFLAFWGLFAPWLPWRHACTVGRGRLPAGGQTLTEVTCSSQCLHVLSRCIPLQVAWQLECVCTFSACDPADSDHSSDVAIVEPVDQAAAVVLSVADLLTASDFTPHLLNDPHAPMVTVLIEEQALAPARVLARVTSTAIRLGSV